MNSTKECEFLTACPIFALYHSMALADATILLYCKGTDKVKCARRKLKLQDKTVPENLLPTGDFF